MKRTLIALALFSAAVLCPAHEAAVEMSKAANEFLNSLSPELKTKTTFELKSDERLNWHFIPKLRKGVTLKELSSQQKNLAMALLHSGLSEMGHTKASNIMSLDTILRGIEKGSGPVRDSELYYFSIFGTPEPRGTWGWRVEGHHLSVNFTIVKGEMFSGTPSFFGSNPADVKTGPRQGFRALADEEDFGRALVKSLRDEQQKIAIYDTTAPKDVLTANKPKVTPLEKVGITAAQMTVGQKTALRKLVEIYVGRLRGDLAKIDLAKIDKAGWDKLQFAWAGSTEKYQPHYYRVQGPTFLLEYDNTQNDANHIHAVWRDFDNDFGEDLLRQHLRDAH
ncbi:MAG TPA: DUF3500 domain-containing protein [Candidatus Acidoferrum sp.]|nr:DUF3500 domain-containing protein [Candidatus Acidoferrum sp.]